MITRRVYSATEKKTGQVGPRSNNDPFGGIGGLSEQYVRRNDREDLTGAKKVGQRVAKETKKFLTQDGVNGGGEEGL